MTCGLYCIINKINKKEYYGQSTDLERREKEYFNYEQFPNDHLKNAFNKYGKENFKFEIIKVCKEKYLDRYEKLYIRIHNTQNPKKGYNKDTGGNLNKHRSEETKKKLSKAHTGKTLSEETKQKISKKTSGKNNPSYRDDIDDNILINEYCNNKLNVVEIANKYNIAKSTVCSRLEKNGIERRTISETNSGKNNGRYRDDLNDNIIIDMYVNQRLTMQKIADKLNASVKTIKQRLINNGIEINNNPQFRDDIPSPQELFDEYNSSNISYRELAKKYNCGRNTIMRRIKKVKP